MNSTQRIEKVLSCSTDREKNIPGSWFLPNGTKVPDTYIALGNQTVGLNITNIADLPSGIYHCEMMDRENVTHHLYAGIYPEDEGRCANKL